MQTSVSRARATPLHVQIRLAIQEQLTGGELEPGAQLPSEHEFARRFGVSLAPVRQALAELVNSGLLERRQGRGTFVREARIEEEFDLLRSFTDNMRSRGVAFVMSVLEAARIPAPNEIGAELELPARSEVVYLRRLAVVQEEPSVLLESYLPARRFERLLSLSGLEEGRSLWGMLESDFGVTLGQSRSTVEIARLTDEQAEILVQSPGTPVLLLRSHTADDQGAVVEISRALYRADRFRFAVTSYRIRPDRPQ